MKFVVRGKNWGRDFRRRITSENFTVHSVFNTVCNLQALPKKPLLAMVTRTEARSPNSLWLPDANFSFLRAGEQVVWEGHFLSCGELTIDCSDTKDWSLQETSIPGNLTVMEYVERWLELQFPGFISNSSQLICQLCEGLEEENWPETREALLKLIGSGEGLTPSGDDFVAGVLLGYIRGLGNRKSPFLQNLPMLIWDLASETNQISQTMLWYAAQGEGAEYLTRTADQLLTAGACSLQYASALTKVGSSSGKYLLAGLLSGINGSRRATGPCDGPDEWDTGTAFVAQNCKFR